MSTAVKICFLFQNYENFLKFLIILAVFIMETIISESRFKIFQIIEIIHCNLECIPRLPSLGGIQYAAYCQTVQLKWPIHMKLLS